MQIQSVILYKDSLFFIGKIGGIKKQKKNNNVLFCLKLR